MDGNYGLIKLVAGNSNPKLAKDISKYLDVPLLKMDTHRFSAEKSLWMCLNPCTVTMFMWCSPPECSVMII